MLVVTVQCTRQWHLYLTHTSFDPEREKSLRDPLERTQSCVRVTLHLLELADQTAQFEVIIFQDFAASSLSNDAFNLQTGQPDRPVLANGKHSTTRQKFWQISVENFCKWDGKFLIDWFTFRGCPELVLLLRNFSALSCPFHGHLISENISRKLGGLPLGKEMCPRLLLFS